MKPSIAFFRCCLEDTWLKWKVSWTKSEKEESKQNCEVNSDRLVNDCYRWWFQICWFFACYLGKKHFDKKRLNFTRTCDEVCRSILYLWLLGFVGLVMCSFFEITKKGCDVQIITLQRWTLYLIFERSHIVRRSIKEFICWVVPPPTGCNRGKWILRFSIWDPGT